MEDESDDSLTPLLALIKYKELAQDPNNHAEMIRDSTAINFLAYVLDSSDVEVLKTSLDALDLLCESVCGRRALRSTFGVLEALTALSTKTPANAQIKEKAEKIMQKLKNAETPVTRPGKIIPSRKKKILTMHILGLHLETQKDLEDILMKKMKGIHSVIVDVEHQKCTVTVYEHVDPKNIATVISENTNMEAQLITRNKFNQEILVPLIENEKTLDLEGLPAYLDEKDSPVKENAVKSTKDFRITASEWFCTAAGFLQRTLYCSVEQLNIKKLKISISEQLKKDCLATTEEEKMYKISFKRLEEALDELRETDKDAFDSRFLHPRITLRRSLKNRILQVYEVSEEIITA